MGQSSSPPLKKIFPIINNKKSLISTFPSLASPVQSLIGPLTRVMFSLKLLDKKNTSLLTSKTSLAPRAISLPPCLKLVILLSSLPLTSQTERELHMLLSLTVYHSSLMLLLFNNNNNNNQRKRHIFLHSLEPLLFL